MINVDENALVCDLAETYNIYDYRSLPCKKVAAFSYGLRNDSRIKMMISGMSITSEEMLLAAIVDNTKMLAWLQSKDGIDGTNRPQSVLSQLMGYEKMTNDEVVTFDTGEDFQKEWVRRTEVKGDQ